MIALGLLLVVIAVAVLVIHVEGGESAAGDAGVPPPRHGARPAHATAGFVAADPEVAAIYARLRAEGASEVYARSYATTYVAYLARATGAVAASSALDDDEFGESGDEDPDDAEDEGYGYSCLDDSDQSVGQAWHRRQTGLDDEDRSFNDGLFAASGLGDAGHDDSHWLRHDTNWLHDEIECGHSCINPATGLPMIGDSPGGFDVGGNAYGFSHSDPFDHHTSFGSDPFGSSHHHSD